MVILYSKAYKHMHDKKVFLDENPKNKVFKHAKTPEKPQKYQNVPQQKNS